MTARSSSNARPQRHKHFVDKIDGQERRRRGLLSTNLGPTAQEASSSTYSPRYSPMLL